MKTTPVSFSSRFYYKGFEIGKAPENIRENLQDLQKHYSNDSSDDVITVYSNGTVKVKTADNLQAQVEIRNGEGWARFLPDRITGAVREAFHVARNETYTTYKEAGRTPYVDRLS